MGFLKKLFFKLYYLKMLFLFIGFFSKEMKFGLNFFKVILSLWYIFGFFLYKVCFMLV